MKMFRRIFALTMVIAMVCLFSASAFALQFTKYEEYGSNGEFVTATGELYEKSAYANMELAIGEAVDDYLSICITCTFTNNHGVTETDWDSAAFYSEYGGSLSYYYSKVSMMKNATYDFYAEFNINSGYNTVPETFIESETLTYSY